MENKELIAFKGMVDGVRINLGDEGGFLAMAIAKSVLGADVCHHLTRNGLNRL